MGLLGHVELQELNPIGQAILHCPLLQHFALKIVGL